VVEQIVWSVTTVFDAEGRSKLMSLLPVLLPRLREGFETISYNPFEMNKLLTQLEQEHLRQLRAPQKPVATEIIEAEEVEVVELSVKAPLEAPDTAAGTPSVTQDAERGLVDVDVKADKSNSDVSGNKKVVSAVAVSASAAAPIDNEERSISQEPSIKDVSSSWLEQVDRFSQGSWFEVSEANKPSYRCRLAAVIKAVDKYIFVNRNGMKVAEKTRQELALALQQGHFSILDDGMLFDRALESVIGNLRQSRGHVS